MKDTFKRKSTLLICIGLILYVVSICIPSVTVDTSMYTEETGREVIGDNGIVTWPIMVPFCIVPILIGLVEFICAIANKKAVFILSVIQTVVSVLVFVMMAALFSFMEASGDLVSKSIIIYFPVVACALLLVGGIMYRKENIVSGGAQ